MTLSLVFDYLHSLLLLPPPHYFGFVFLVRTFPGVSGGLWLSLRSLKAHWEFQVGEWGLSTESFTARDPVGRYGNHCIQDLSFFPWPVMFL